MASRAQSSPLPIFNLTLRQFRGGKSLRIMAIFALVPTIFALVYMFNSGSVEAHRFMAEIFKEFIAPTIIPIATLILATNALGAELEDRTMIYLILKPIRRMKIVLEKFGAVVIATTLALWVGLVVSYILVMRGDSFTNANQLLAMAGATLIGVLGYGSLFMMASLMIPRALLVGLFYTLLWESFLARFLPGIRLISVRHYVQSFYVKALDNPGVTLDQATPVTATVLVIIALVVLTLAISTWRLRAMNYE